MPVLEWRVLLLLPPSEESPCPTTALPRPRIAHFPVAHHAPQSRAPGARRREQASGRARRAGCERRLADEVARNVPLVSAPAAPAARVYSGVLYAAAALADLPPAAAARAEESVRIVSALWGAVSPPTASPRTGCR
ncbi:peroxide stress protein YaaA [Oerskovia sp. M15]